MPRQARKESGTGIYHVMLRGINRQDIFEDAKDYMRMLRCMQQMLEQYDDQGNRLPPLCTFYAYCLMSNHVHLLLRVNQEDIGSTIKHLTVLPDKQWFIDKLNRSILIARELQQQ